MLLHYALLCAVSAITEDYLTASFLGRAPLDGCTTPQIIGQCTARAQIDVVFLLDTTDQANNIERNMVTLDLIPKLVRLETFS